MTDRLALAALALSSSLLWAAGAVEAQTVAAPEAVAAAAVPVRASADPDLRARVRLAEAWLATQLAGEGVPGAAYAIVFDQETLAARGLGHADEARRVPVTADTRFSVCSISKLFTSIAVMQERDSGRLNLDAPIETYVPWARLAPVPGAAGGPEPVTARAILSHVSGLPREVDLPYWRQARFPDTAAVRSRVSTQAMLYRPFDTYQYSNLGMTLVAEAAAATSGLDYHALLKSRILDPLGLRSTTSELPNTLRGRDFAVGWTARRTGWDRTTFEPYTLSGIAPAAGFASSARDLGRFAAWQFRVLAGGGDEVLKASTLREMHRAHWVAPDRPDQMWGLGFRVANLNGKTVVGHGGWCPGYRSALLLRPQDRLAVALLTNADDADAQALAEGMWELVLSDASRIASGKPAPPRTRDLSAFEGVYGTRRSASDMAVVQVENELLSLPLFVRRNLVQAIDRWKPAGPDRFHRVLPGGGQGDELRFERDARGRIVRLWVHSNPLERMDGPAVTPPPTPRAAIAP